MHRGMSPPFRDFVLVATDALGVASLSRHASSRRSGANAQHRQHARVPSVGLPLTSIFWSKSGSKIMACSSFAFPPRTLIRRRWPPGPTRRPTHTCIFLPLEVLALATPITSRTTGFATIAERLLTRGRKRSRMNSTQSRRKRSPLGRLRSSPRRGSFRGATTSRCPTIWRWRGRSSSLEPGERFIGRPKANTRA